jgi:hypothetical protein
MYDYDVFVEFMMSWKHYETTDFVDPFFCVDGEYCNSGLEIIY